MEKPQINTGVTSFREFIAGEDAITADLNGLLVAKTLCINLKYVI